MSKEVEIRTSCSEDASGVREAIDRVAKERRYLALLDAPSIEEVASFIADPNVAMLVAICDARVVGWVDVQRMHRPGYVHRGVLGMGVVSSYRRQGIGRLLLSKVFDRARELGIEKIELEVFRSNVGAISLYESAGFKPEGERLRARILDGAVDDALLMCRWSGATTPLLDEAQ
jgi:ribosomal protein S18 acetylase RimI-like enzyme